MQHLTSVVPPDAFKLALVLAISLFVGLEREEHKQHDARYAFGGIRTFPLIGLASYALALLSGDEHVPWAIGFAVVGGFMALSYYHKLAADPAAGLTTEVSALVTYAIGGLVVAEHYWIALTLGVLSVLLLELKKSLEGLTRHIAPDEIITVAKFLVLAGVILPILPDRDLTGFRLNPFKTWIVAVAVSGVSFASYVIQRVLKGRGGLLVAAILGGAYSSTVTTVVLAREARQGDRPDQFAGAILTASAVMYARLIVLVALFDAPLAGELAPPFLVLAAVGALGGVAAYRRRDGGEPTAAPRRTAKNPLELRAALVFAAVFVAIQIATRLAREYLGQAGLFALAAIMGVSDVDPFILGLTQASSAAVSPESAAVAIAIAAASNNVIKAIYAYVFARGEAGRKSLVLLVGFAALGLVAIIWFAAR